MIALTHMHDGDTMQAMAPDLPTIKTLAFKHKVDYRTLRRFFAGVMPKGKLVRAACERAAKAWRATVERKAAA